MIRPLIRRASVTTAVLLSALTLSATQASAAYPTAYNTKTIWMQGGALLSLPTSCVSKEIYLAEGDYEWSQTRGGQVSASRYTHLQAGTYGWKDCLFPDNGYYNQLSYLTAPGGGNAVTPISTDWDPVYDGTYTWGSYLDPSF